MKDDNRSRAVYATPTTGASRVGPVGDSRTFDDTRPTRRIRRTKRRIGPGPVACEHRRIHSIRLQFGNPRRIRWVAVSASNSSESNDTPIQYDNSS